MSRDVKAVGRAPTERRRGIQSVEIGLRVLSAIAAHRGSIGLSSIGQATGLSASQAHRYLSSLIASGMVKQEQRSGHYDLDAGAIRIGLSALARIDVFRMADTIFDDFSNRTGRTVLLAIWGDAGATIVRWFDGSPPVITSLAIGSVLPLLRSATGRVFYAFADPGQIARIGPAALRAEERRFPDAEALRRQTSAEQTASVSGDLIPGLNAVAAPVFDLQGRLALVASALSNRGDATSEAETRETLLAACRSLTEALGGQWPEATVDMADDRPAARQGSPEAKPKSEQPARRK